VQRSQLLVGYLELDLRARVIAELELGHGPDRHAADLHLVALHELARVVERDRDPVRLARGKQQPGEHEDRDCEGCKRQQPRQDR
jgi:hypothetical protein